MNRGAWWAIVHQKRVGQDWATNTPISISTIICIETFKNKTMALPNIKL